MNNPYAAFFRKNQGHRGFCDCIHCRGGYRDIEFYVSGKMGFEGNFPWKYFRPGRNEKYIVEGETFLSDTFVITTHN